jgi:hypothetical protein
MTEEALQLLRASLYKKLAKEKWRDTQKAANNWRNFEAHAMQTLASLLEKTPERTTAEFTLPGDTGKYAVVLGLSDLHYGKYGDPDEVGSAVNREIIEDRALEAVQKVLRSVSFRGKPEKIFIPVGSDFFHIDTSKKTTTLGTAQDTDGTPAEILEGGCLLMEKIVELTRQVAPVELVLMSGNHDRLLGVAVLLFLAARYEGAEDVLVHRDRTPRVYKVYGTNLIGFVHGDAVSKTGDLAGLMSMEASKHWHSCQSKTIYTGHYHFEKTEVDHAHGVVRRQLPSLSGTDRWHNLHGYVGGGKTLAAYIHDRKAGLVSVDYATMF